MYHPNVDANVALRHAKNLMPKYVPIEHRVAAEPEADRVNLVAYWRRRYEELSNALLLALSDYQHDMMQVARIPGINDERYHTLVSRLRNPLPAVDTLHQYTLHYTVKVNIDAELPFGKDPLDFWSDELLPALDDVRVEVDWSGAGSPDRVRDWETIVELDDITNEEVE